MATAERSVRDLEKPEKLSHQAWEWTFERIGWTVAALLLVAAALGLLGRGLLTSQVRVSGDGSLRATYYSAEHYQATSQLHLNVADEVESPVQIAISRSFLDETEPQSIWPTPLATESRRDSVLYTFDLGESREIIYRYKHETYGWLSWRVGVADREPLVVQQFVYP